MSISRWRDERGVVIPILALALPVLILMVAFAVDLGRQRADRRLAQSGADVVALDLMRVVQGRTFDDLINNPTVAAEVSDALDDSAARNGFLNTVGTVPPDPDPNRHQPRVVALDWGVIPALNDGDSFVYLDENDPDDLATSPTAVLITTARTTDYFFQPGENGVTRTAIVALPQALVDVTVGSLAAGFQPSIPDSVGLSATVQALNARLAAQFGATIPNPGTAGFDLVGYRGLAAADVDLERVAANAGFASADEMLASDMTAGQFFSATATALDQQAAEGDPNAANAATQFRRFESQMGVDSTGEMRLGDTIGASQGGAGGAAATTVNVLDLLSGGANVINGESFASYNFAPGIPGVAVANVRQHLVRTRTKNPDQPVGGGASNTQMRFQIDLQVAPLTGMTAPLRIPLVVEAARADGRVDRLDCTEPIETSEAEIDVTTSGATVRIGTATDLEAETLVVTPGVLVEGGVGALNSAVFLALGLNPLQILGLNLNGSLTATGSASVLGGFSEHVFTPYAVPNPYQRAPGGVGGTTIGTQLSSSLAATLATSALSSAVNNALATQLAPVFSNLQASILNPIMQQAGVAIAGADLLAEQLECDGAGLRLVG